MVGTLTMASATTCHAVPRPPKAGVCPGASSALFLLRRSRYHNNPPAPVCSPDTVQSKPEKKKFSFFGSKKEGNASGGASRRFPACPSWPGGGGEGGWRRIGPFVWSCVLTVPCSCATAPLPLSAVRKADISAPLDFVHEVHVGFDPETGEFSVRRAPLGAGSVSATPARAA